MEFTTLLNTSLELNTFSDQQRVDSLPSSDSYVDERGVLKEELKRLSEENKDLRQLLNAMQENYDSLQEQMINSSSERKRRAETRNLTKEELALCGESSSIDRNCSKKPRQHESTPMISRVLVKTDASDTSLIVKDEYKWRKYGQKVTKDNPFPKAYFKCGSSPNCPVKKKVQRSMEDQGIVVVTYEGEHNHALALNADTGVAKCTSSRSSLEPKATKQKVSDEESACFNANPEVQKMFMEKMASTLAKDSSLREALAAAISERFLVQSIHK